MNSTQISGLTAHEIFEKIKNKSLKEEDAVNAVISRINTVDNKIKGFVYFNESEARRRFTEIKNNGLNDKPLSFIPVAVKDNICVKDELTTCASKILKGFKPPYDATVVKNLKKSGALLMGKANMDEFAFGSSCETSFYGPTFNPYDLERIPGGSSGGSAALVASDEVVMAIGSDTGGSIRQPASLCGVVGLKPTYGLVSRYGLIAFASSLDQIGPITKDVEDCAILLNVISGKDDMDSTSADVATPDYTKALVDDVKGMKIGLPKEYFIGGIEKDVENRIHESINLFKDLGAEIINISLPHTQYAVATYYIVACSEASSNLARFDGIQYGLRSQSETLLDVYRKTRADGFGKEAKRRAILGTYALSSGYYDAYYLKAQKVRTLIKKDFDEAFNKCDVILTPTSPTTAFKLNERTEDPLKMYLSDIFTIPANLAGIPAISLPCGYSENGLPIGMQIMAKAFDETNIFRASYTFEKNKKFEYKKPKL